MPLTVDPASRITDLPGLSVGHWTDREGATGCSVILFDRLAPAGVRIWGGAPGVCEASLLDPSALVPGVDAILLTGGSAYGLDAAGGVRRFLEEQGRGFPAAGFTVPIVPAAVIFDLAAGDGRVRPGVDEGYEAARSATPDDRSAGRIGAGTGARVAKYRGYAAGIDAGLASRSATIDGVKVGVLVVNNCYGGLIDPATGRYAAAPTDETGATVGYLDGPVDPPQFGNTVIGVVATDAALTKAEAGRVAAMAMAGIARCVVPAFSPYDGDALFAASVGEKRGDVTRIGAVAARLVEACLLATVVDAAL
jgi:L-aminopeptidase/D-esterase-like protein